MVHSYGPSPGEELQVSLGCLWLSQKVKTKQSRREGAVEFVWTWKGEEGEQKRTRGAAEL